MLQPVVTWFGGDGRQQRVLLTEMGEQNSKQGVRRSRRGMTQENLLQGVAGPVWPGGTVYQGLQLPEMEQIRGKSQRSRYEGCVSLPFSLHMTRRACPPQGSREVGFPLVDPTFHQVKAASQES